MAFGCQLWGLNMRIVVYGIFLLKQVATQKNTHRTLLWNNFYCCLTHFQRELDLFFVNSALPYKCKAPSSKHTHSFRGTLWGRILWECIKGTVPWDLKLPSCMWSLNFHLFTETRHVWVLKVWVPWVSKGILFLKISWVISFVYRRRVLHTFQIPVVFIFYHVDLSNQRYSIKLYCTPTSWILSKMALMGPPPFHILLVD